MSIEIRQKGEAQAAAKAGTMIGNANKIARQRAMEWEMEKAEIRSRQVFEQELREQQYKYDALNRAKEWQIEKMEIASRMDFEQEERKRVRREAEFNAGVEAIDKDDTRTDEWKDTAKFRLASKYYDVPDAAKYLGLSNQGQESALDQYIAQAMGKGKQAGGTSSGSNLAQADEMYVIDPQGNPAIIKTSDWRSGEAAKEGFTLAPGQQEPELPMKTMQTGMGELESIGEQQQTELMKKHGLAAPIWEKGAFDYWLKTKGLKEWWR
jgi:hypothetical protein